MKTDNTGISIKEFKKFAKKNPEKAKQRAKEILIKTGVLTKSGKKKDAIVSWQ